MSNAIAKARELLRERIHQIDTERRQLEDALSKLVGGRHPRGAGTSRQRSAPADGASRRATQSRRRKVAGRGERQRQLVAHLKGHPGSRPSEIAKALGVSSANVQNVLRNARTEGVVVKRDGGYALSDKATKARRRSKPGTAKAASSNRTSERKAARGGNTPASAK
jgi:biotin operon repressor